VLQEWLPEQQEDYYRKIVSRGKNDGVREVQVCVGNLAAYAGGCAMSECLVFSVVARDEELEVG
jgi:hypothetical protein